MIIIVKLSSVGDLPARLRKMAEAPAPPLPLSDGLMLLPN
jgi:hypothetical protein